MKKDISLNLRDRLKKELNGIITDKNKKKKEEMGFLKPI